MDSLYNSWQLACERISQEKLVSWKREKDVYYMLEHVPGEYATVYLDLILKEGITVKDVQTYTDLVDKIGDAHRHNFKFGIVSSTTCLRYLYHAIDIVKKLEMKTPNLVEIGGGYGGLAVAMNFVLSLKKMPKLSYTIVDLTNVQKLQKYYTTQFVLNNIDLDFIDSKLYGSNVTHPNIFIISNYCLAEMGEHNRQQYITNLIMKPTVIGGYFQWNSGASLDFLMPFSPVIEEEEPKTGPDNKTVLFYNL